MCIRDSGMTTCICKYDAMIRWVRSCKLREPSGNLPIKCSGFNYNTSYSCTVTSYKFGGWLNYDVRAMFNRAHKIRCCKCIIYYKRDTVCMSNFWNRFNICNFGIRIAKRFNEDRFSILLNGCFEFLRFKRIYKCSIDSISSERVIKKIISTSINIIGCNDMVSGKRKILNGVWNCRCTWCDRQTGCAIFERCDSFLKYALCRISKSSVNIACIS